MWGVRGVELVGIPLPSVGEHGMVSGDGKETNEVKFNFGGRSGDLILKYEVYDADTSTEIQILLNGYEVGYAPLSEDNGWGGMQRVVLSDEYVNDSGMNIVTFNSTCNPPNAWMWGVRNVSVAECFHFGLTVEHGMVSGDPNQIDEVSFKFGGLAGDVVVKHEVYDADNGSEIQILLNGYEVGYAPLSGNNSWGGEQRIILPDEYVNDSGINILTFNSTCNPPNAWMWGVRNVSVE
jgi:hypothetical protein